MGEKFVVDASTLIQAHRSRYPFDVFPTFWEKLHVLALNGQLISIDKVKDEVYTNSKDPLTNWCMAKLPQVFFQSTNDLQVLTNYGALIQWANALNGISATAFESFSQSNRADAWLVAFAQTHNYKIVTEEVSAPNSKKDIKLPDACAAHNVHCCNCLAMLRTLGVTI